MSAELGDWLLRSNGGEGMSQCAPALVCGCLSVGSAPGLMLNANAVRRSDMDFMFGFFKRLHQQQLSVTDLHFSSHATFRKYVDGLCSQENSGWKRVDIPDRKSVV